MIRWPHTACRFLNDLGHTSNIVHAIMLVRRNLKLLYTIALDFFMFFLGDWFSFMHVRTSIYVHVWVYGTQWWYKSIWLVDIVREGVGRVFGQRSKIYKVMITKRTNSVPHEGIPLQLWLSLTHFSVFFIIQRQRQNYLFIVDQTTNQKKKKTVLLVFQIVILIYTSSFNCCL